MARISQRSIGQFLAAGQAAATTTEKGKAFEDLICYLFECIPGISVTKRNTLDVFQAEEIDVAFWNDQHHQGLRFLPNIILVECKNWSVAVSNDEVVFFDEKLRRRGLSFGILVAANGITGDPMRRTAAHETVARAH
jgi:Restriction endonuclease